MRFGLLPSRSFLPSVSYDLMSSSRLREATKKGRMEVKMTKCSLIRMKGSKTSKGKKLQRSTKEGEVMTIRTT